MNILYTSNTPTEQEWYIVFWGKQTLNATSKNKQ